MPPSDNYLAGTTQCPKHTCACIHTCTSDIRSFDLCDCNYGGHISSCRRTASDCPDSISGAQNRPCRPAGSDLRQHSNQIAVDTNSASHPGCSLSPNPSNHLPHP